jgi:hypothetical protein
MMSIARSSFHPVLIAALAIFALAPIAVADAARAGNQDDGAMQKYEVRKDHAGHTVYCAQVAPTTGSRIAQTRCETAEGWKAEGVDLHIASNSG